MKKPNVLYFDIETTGFSPRESSILSISAGKEVGKVTSQYADPIAGTKMSEWVTENVWNKIVEEVETRNITPKKEWEIIENFIKRLEGQKAGTKIAGWNIGYGKSGGFDIGFLSERAKQYGLGDRFQKAIGRLQIRDIGREFLTTAALRTYEQTRNMPRSEINKIFGSKLYGQLEPFAADVYQKHQQGMSIPEIARRTSSKRVHGWSQGLAFELMTGREMKAAHLSAADVENMITMMQKGKMPQGKQLLGNWASLMEKTRAQSKANFIRKGRVKPFGDVFGRKINGLGKIGGRLQGIGALALLASTLMYQAKRSSANPESAQIRQGKLAEVKVNQLPFNGEQTNRSMNMVRKQREQEKQENNRDNIFKWMIDKSSSIGRYSSVGLSAMAAIKSKHHDFDYTLRKMVGKEAAPIVKRVPGLLFIAGGITEFAFNPSARTLGSFAATAVGWKAGSTIARPLGNAVGMKYGHKGLPMIISHLGGLAVSALSKHVYQKTYDSIGNSGKSAVKTDFGSPWRGPKVSGIISHAMARNNPVELNVVEGLMHGGFAEQIRHAMTPFGGVVNKFLTKLGGGSGKGVKDLWKTVAKEADIAILPKELRNVQLKSKNLQDIQKKFSSASGLAVNRKELMQTATEYRQIASAYYGARGMDIPKPVQQALDRWQTQVGKVTSTGGQQGIVISEGYYLEKAASKGVEKAQLGLKGTIEHERAHALLAETISKDKIIEHVQQHIPQEFERKLREIPVYSKASKAEIAEEFLAYSAEYRLLKAHGQEVPEYFTSGIQAVERFGGADPKAIARAKYDPTFKQEMTNRVTKAMEETFARRNQQLVSAEIQKDAQAHLFQSGTKQRSAKNTFASEIPVNQNANIDPLRNGMIPPPLPKNRPPPLPSNRPPPLPKNKK